MLKLHITDIDGSQAEIEAKPGYTVMETLKSYNYTAIEAACGGSCSCATCHVIVDASWFDRLALASEAELEMLSWAPAREPHSRLSCQILLDETLDGLRLKIATPAPS